MILMEFLSELRKLAPTGRCDLDVTVKALKEKFDNVKSLYAQLEAEGFIKRDHNALYLWDQPTALDNNCKPKDVTGEMRARAKVKLFGQAYGSGPIAINRPNIQNLKCWKPTNINLDKDKDLEITQSVQELKDTIEAIVLKTVKDGIASADKEIFKVYKQVFVKHAPDACNKCLYKVLRDIPLGEWCHMFKDLTPGPCGQFKEIE